MAARGEALVARASTGAHAATVVDPRGTCGACGRTDRQTQRLPAVPDNRRAHEPERRNTRGADSIPIARHRLGGRFSPTGSFAYRTRGNAAPLATACAPRPPGKRLSALWRSLHSDPMLTVGRPGSAPQSCRSFSRRGRGNRIVGDSSHHASNDGTYQPCPLFREKRHDDLAKMQLHAPSKNVWVRCSISRAT